MSRKDGQDYFSHQAEKLMAKSKPRDPRPAIPPFKRTFEPEKIIERPPEPMVVEESDASNTIIERVKAFWK